MNKYYYDLHIHSCLSPCGDNDMTPNNIAGMAALKGLQIVALTDHNTARNCPAFMAACKKNGLVGISGMELTTAEDVHMLCLFEHLEDALAFSDAVDTHRIKIPNRPEIFGDQLLLDENDVPVGTEDALLINATTLSVDEAVVLAREFHAFITPAHIDKEANGIVSILGAFPDSPSFSAVEFGNKENEADFSARFSPVRDALKLYDSDAHYLWDIAEAEHFFLLDDEPYSADLVRQRLFRLLLGSDKS